MTGTSSTGFNSDLAEWITVDGRSYRAARPGAVWLTKAQTAHALGVCTATVRNLTAAGKLTARIEFGDGGKPHPKYLAAGVERLAAERKAVAS
jgi:hypothetical protein